jgi:hypothetical protein
LIGDLVKRSPVTLLKELGESKSPEVFILVAIVCTPAGSGTFYIKRERTLEWSRTSSL